MAVDIVKGYTNYDKPNGNGFMDISANGARTAFKASTDFSKMPQPGPHDRPIALFMEGHFGILGNDGNAYESTPPCVRKYPWKGGGWKAWAPFPDKWLSWQDGVIRTHEEILALCESVIGMPYWYGCFGQAPTRDLLAYKRKQYPSQYACIKSLGNYEGAIGKYAVVMDCIGLGRYICLAKRVKISKTRPGESNISVPPQAPTEAAGGFSVGNHVRMNHGTKEYYPGLRVPEWVPGKTYTVTQVLNNGKPVVKGGKTCVLLDELTTWCATENLMKV